MIIFRMENSPLYLALFYYIIWFILFLLCIIYFILYNLKKIFLKIKNNTFFHTIQPLMMNFLLTEIDNKHNDENTRFFILLILFYYFIYL
jgi:hypothetical protein